MKLLVGLGNPGPQYRDTRHNVGFWVIDEIARRWLVSDGWRERDEALVAKKAGGSILVKPMTFMNLSGFAVSRLRQFYQIEPADILVVFDDAALPLGRLRARRGGSAGGHNGLRSVIEQLGTTQIPRLRIGVGRPSTSLGASPSTPLEGSGERRDLADHVLSKFDPEERDTIVAATLRAADAAELFVTDGIERVMSAFNAATDTKQEDTGA
ncbi:MAG TPA: aminoacyl-tRNA hydrolase [Sphingomicrobium sp.]|nr:aminoacyl-tRNA hydrolase [Sphingomicrobium sp.]